MKVGLTEVVAALGDPLIAADVVAWIDRMPPDPSLSAYLQKLRRIGAGRERYWDLACALNCLTRVMTPRRYLEIGVRRGKSMVQIAGRVPGCEIVGIDLWIQPYGGVDNPGPDYVRSQMRAVGHHGALALLSGDSHAVLPQYVHDHPDVRFDIVTVDGDHTDDGAWEDLRNVAPLVDAGGYLLFDDLIHPAHTLGPVWDRFQAEFADEFAFTTNVKDHNGTGLARRVA
jgi:predicted O-methyltransferase YrrM